MRIALFGGIYNNYLALDAAIRDAESRGAERLFCLGDMGAFGPYPDRVFPLLQDANVECVQGNYDDSVGNGLPDCQCGYDPRLLSCSSCQSSPPSARTPNSPNTSSASSGLNFRVAGVERREPPVRERWGLATLDPSHPKRKLRPDKALGTHLHSNRQFDTHCRILADCTTSFRFLRNFVIWFKV